jgi:hypothetical protein
MRLYLHQDLVKSEKNEDSPKAPKATGEQKGGNYVARVQDGYDGEGKPKYRYFKTQDEYQSYIKKKGGKKDGSELQSKVEKEHKDSVKKVEESQKNGKDLLSKETKKSMRLFIKEGL